MIKYGMLLLPSLDVDKEALLLRLVGYEGYDRLNHLVDGKDELNLSPVLSVLRLVNANDYLDELLVASLVVDIFGKVRLTNPQLKGTFHELVWFSLCDGAQEL